MFIQQLARVLEARLWRRAAQPLPACGQEDASEPVLGCGWFDSSHDLHAGLCVQEHASADAVAQDLPLTDWLDMQLSGWRAAPVT